MNQIKTVNESNKYCKWIECLWMNQIKTVNDSKESNKDWMNQIKTVNESNDLMNQIKTKWIK